MRAVSCVRNQKGSGLIGAMIAAALVAATAMVVAYFYVSQRKVSANMDNSLQCQQTLKSVVEYVSKDNNSLYITSAGPTDANATPLTGEPFGANFLTKDNVQQFPQNMSVAAGTGSAVDFTTPLPSYNNVERVLSPNWQFRNSFNIRNTFNRVLSLAYATPGVCCDNLDDMYGNDPANPGCGVLFNPAELGVDAATYAVVLAAQFVDGSGAAIACNSLAANVPTARNNSTVRIRAQVFTRPGLPDQKFCTADTTGYFSSDTTPPLVLMSDLNNGALCGGGTDAQYTCNPGATAISFDVRTVKNSNGTNCETCLLGLSDNACPGVQDPMTVCGNVCPESDPGSLYLCRIGEKHWFDMNKNHWEPCEQTAVYGCQSGQFIAEGGLESNATQTCIGRVSLGRVQIVYDGNTQGPNNNPARQIGTRATITLSGLTVGRAYEIDVRAVDTRGLQASRSFEALAGAGFTQGPHFIVPNEPPVLSGMTETTALIDSAGRPQGAISVPDTSVYGGMTGNYQCQAGDVSFSADVNYPSMPAWVYPFLEGETCEVELSGGTPVGTVAGSSCACSNGQCYGTARVSSGGNWNASMSVSNICGTAGTGDSYGPWCYEDVSVMSTTVQVSNQNTDTPTLNVNVTAAKKCAVSAGVGRVNNPNPVYQMVNTIAGTPDYTTSFSSLGWIPLQHSGCESYNAVHAMSGYSQVCSLVTDVCGRQTTARTTYESALTLGAAAQNSCFNTSPPGAYHITGNACVTSGYCDVSGKCKDQAEYPYAGTACAKVQGGGSYPNSDIDYPCGHVTDCAFGTSYQKSGSCVGDRYDCVSGVHTDTGSCTSSGGACVISNVCQGRQNICFDGSNNPTENPCVLGVCGSGEHCGVKSLSGQCSKTNEACTDDSDCPVLNGTCQVGAQGVCQAPSNRSCESCPRSEAIVSCPVLYGGCGNTNTQQFGSGSCAAPASPVCTPGACVPGNIVSQGECLLADGVTPAPLGQPGTRLTQYECSNGCAACACAPVSEACTGTDIRGKWCRSGREDACSGAPTEGFDSTASCTIGQIAMLNYPCCEGSPHCEMSNRWECVPLGQACSFLGDPGDPSCCSGFSGYGSNVFDAPNGGCMFVRPDGSTHTQICN